MYWHSLLQSPPALQNHPVQHCQSMPHNSGFTKPEGNKTQPTRAYKLETTLVGFDSLLKMLLKLHVLVLMQSLKTLRRKGAAVYQFRGADCIGCFVAEIPDT